MIAVAVLLLPGLALLVFVTVRLEDGLLDPEGPASSARHARHARRHHLRLIPGGGGAPTAPERHRRPQGRNRNAA
ncbi:hypothetical protein DMA15_00895 [Streptomyces sp. WAC 01529]|uniref:hypothetical protein n=1 Tax=Streptomyces sp. WAC 01529 TaxID=2203205 RepID=UPI000F701595|nr:hypothetical protein [Streptomyces sp. WAC 01529]AZM51316.1 hypothetical protein DMA15_00895 [Streptomyces sp. WAC 01529]